MEVRNKETIKEVYKNEFLFVESTNKETGEKGIAIPTNNSDYIKIFEGAGDGSDDKIITYNELFRKYNLIIKHE